MMASRLSWLLLSACILSTVIAGPLDIPAPTPAPWEKTLNRFGFTAVTTFLNGLLSTSNGHTSDLAALRATVATLQQQVDLLSSHVAQLQTQLNARAQQQHQIDVINATLVSRVLPTQARQATQLQQLNSSVGLPASLSIFHFNDFYNIEGMPQKDGTMLGGIARAVTFRKRHANALAVFSGDVFFPSVISFNTSGQNMVWALNLMNISVAVVGVNEAMQGLTIMETLIARCNFPWLSANIVNKSGLPFVKNTKATHIIDHPSGLRLGFLGLSSDYTGSLNADGAFFLDPVVTARRLAAQLKDQDGCDLVIAVTHQNFPVDLSLLTEPMRIDMVLGGQDFFNYTRFGDRILVRDGVQLNHIGIVDVSWLTKTKPLLFAADLWVTPMDSNIPKDAETDAGVTEYLKLLPPDFFDSLVNTTVDLDVQQASLRISETNMGNYFAGAYASYWNSSLTVGLPSRPILGLIPGGSLRVDTFIEDGSVLNRGFVYTALPANFKLVLLECTGAVLRAALEQAVAILPKAKFPQISGFRFKFNPTFLAGSRVVSVTYSNLTAIKPTDIFYLAVNSNQRAGGNGYSMFTTIPLLLGPTVENDAAILIAAMERDRRASGVISPVKDGRIESCSTCVSN